MELTLEKNGRTSIVEAFCNLTCGIDPIRLRVVVFGVGFLVAGMIAFLLTGSVLDTGQLGRNPNLPELLAAGKAAAPTGRGLLSPLAATPTPLTASECLQRSASVPSDWPVLMCDAFDDNTNGWQTGPYRDDFAAVNVSIANGAYTWDVEAYDAFGTSRPANLSPLADFYMAVDVYASTDNGQNVFNGLGFRVQDSNNSYLFNIDNTTSTFLLIRLLQGQDSALIQGQASADVFHPDSWNRLAVMALGPTIILYINDQEVGRATDPFIPRGLARLEVQPMAKGHFMTYFDNFEVRQAPADAQPPSVPRVAAAACPNSPVVAPTDWPIFACDTFDGNIYGWRVGVESGGSLKEAMTNIGGTYFCAFKASESTYWWEEPNLESVSDFFLSVQAKRTSLMVSSGYGLVFRMVDYDNLFTFIVDDTQRFMILRKADGQFRNLVEPTGHPAIRPGETNSLAVRGEKRHFTFYINDQQVAELDDIHFKQGKIGLMIYPDRGDEGFVEFDNFEVRTPASKP